ncbi:hypothetical protein E4U17_007871 [Claviceps sp. LM77 group G4]|nr:hypothetical protein E4U17_007871 [Claviceps sp. LM77 group G4]KAG6075410.1 hypothetical protein E4U16_003378 [Claviceps sp. LM84 group G4]
MANKLSSKDLSTLSRAVDFNTHAQITDLLEQPTHVAAARTSGLLDDYLDRLAAGQAGVNASQLKAPMTYNFLRLAELIMSDGSWIIMTQNGTSQLLEHPSTKWTSGSPVFE